MVIDHMLPTTTREPKNHFQNRSYLTRLRIIIMAMMMEFLFSTLELCLGRINICYIG